MFIGADPRENGEEMIPRDNRINIIASCTSFLFANFTKMIVTVLEKRGKWQKTSLIFPNFHK